VLEGKHSTKKVTQCWNVNTAQHREGNTVLEDKHSTEKVNTVLKGKRSTEKVNAANEWGTGRKDSPLGRHRDGGGHIP
jgi:hypothetical protein